MTESAFERVEYLDHIDAITAQWERALAAVDTDAAVVPAGVAQLYFQDDQAPVFHPNPHFARFYPDDNCERSVLLLRPGERPKLYFHRPASYWYQPPTLPEWAEAAFDVETHGDDEELMKSLVKGVSGYGRIVLVGPAESCDLNLPLEAVNPKALVNRLQFARGTKTDFEIALLREATKVGVRGHLAARDAFRAGGSEFDIHMAYLGASKQQESKLPYPNIVALNEHAGVLHYQHYDRARPNPTRSFLIDAGGRSGGYHSDITRTYSAFPGDEFDDLVAGLDAKQRHTVAQVEPGLPFVDLQVRMHRELADLLVSFDILRCSAESAYERSVTDLFFPHGLGHLLGLQTHDVGGHFATEDGELAEPPPRFPKLRFTRAVEPGYVFTVEPGIYFIPSLLKELAESDAGRDVNWPKVESLVPCGGIRIEDNVLVTEDGVENLTRPVFDAFD
ncbi:MAG: Xaa-Pro dipeptidase [Gammaproteobacteria bacterium]|nr:Xaa-Pro dipeptidase [Gammaproteobacteria bacterium]